MEDSLNLLWYVFSAAWLAYFAFVMLVSARQKRIWEQLRAVRERLSSLTRQPSEPRA